MIVVAVLVLSVLGIGLNKYTQKNESQEAMMKKEETVMTKDSTEVKENKEMLEDKDEKKMEKSEDDAKMTTSRYVPYSKEAFDSASKNRRILFFFANWCPICKPADTSFTENVSKIPADVTVIRVNYNDTNTDQEEKELAKKYGITYQHTFVQIDGTGKEIAKWNGGQMDELIRNIK